MLTTLCAQPGFQLFNKSLEANYSKYNRFRALGAANPQCCNLSDPARRKGNRAAAVVVKQHADEAYADLREFLVELRPAFSYQQIASVLNMRSERTRNGKPWTDVAVMRGCRRLGIGPDLSEGVANRTEFSVPFEIYTVVAPKPSLNSDCQQSRVAPTGFRYA